MDVHGPALQVTIMKACFLWCVCAVLVVTLLHPVQGQEFLSEEEMEMEEIMAEDEDEAVVGEGNEVLPDNMDDVPEADRLCSRYSPKEVFHTVVNPHLLKILDELSTFVDASLLRVEDALHTLLPNVDQSPIGNLRAEDLFGDVRTFMFGTMRDSYDVVREAWRELITTHVQKPSSLQQTWVALTRVVDAHSQAERQLVASLQELTVTLKAVVYNSIYVVQASLNLPNNTDDQEFALAISHKLPKIAPNFLGTLISKILVKGSDPSGYKKAYTNPLRSINPLIEKMHAELQAVVAGKEVTEDKAEEEGVMEAFWEAVVKASHTHLQEWPLLKEDFELYYVNEEYLSEVLLQLMASF